MQLSSVGASKTLKSSGINICKSSICLLLKKMPTIMDKFALRKRYSYEIVMVDLETQRIIDLIASRDVNDMRKWLSEYPNIDIVSWDGAQIYASATEGAFLM